MRKVSYWLLAGCLALALTACGDDDDNNNGDKDAGVDSRVDRGTPDPDGPVTQLEASVGNEQGIKNDITITPADQGPQVDNVGKDCTGDADCGGGDYFCLQLYGTDYPGVCTLECTPDDPDTGLYNENSCPNNEQNTCHVLPSDIGQGALCFQTCLPTTGQNTCQGSIGCDPIFSAFTMEYYGSETGFDALCVVAGCSTDDDCLVLGQECLTTATPTTCPTGQQCADLDGDPQTPEGLCVQPGNCDTTTNLCAAHDQGKADAVAGDPCTNNLDCAGNMECFTEFEDTQSGQVWLRNGYCVPLGCWYAETLTEKACPAGSSCNLGYITGFCQRSCDQTDASTCRGVEADRLGDYECRNLGNLYTDGAPVCDFGLGWPCDSYQTYGIGCNWAGAGTVDPTTGELSGNPTNMTCRNLANETLADEFDAAGFCLDDTAASDVLRGQ